ncbi:MAG TPA: acyl carrier protein [Bryobacteraceae bacterium]|jgi:acyl carrier protein
MNAEIWNEVRGIAAGIFQVDPRALSAASSPDRIEKWDSVQHLNLVLALESKYGIAFEPEQMEQMKNLGDIAALVETKLT